MTSPAPAPSFGRFRHRHLLGIEGLSPDEITLLLDLADGYVEQNRAPEKKSSLLRGRTVINLFPEYTPERSPLLPDELRFVRDHGLAYVGSEQDGDPSGSRFIVRIGDYWQRTTAHGQLTSFALSSSRAFLFSK